MDVLLINPRMDTRQRPPLGLAYIAAVVRAAGISVAIFDPLPSENMAVRLKVLLKEQKPKIVGITSTTTQVTLAYELCKLVKDTDDSIKTVLGGPHVTVSVMEIMKNPHVDIAVVGEGERTALELFKTLLNNDSVRNILGIAYKKGREIVQTAPRPLIENLDELSYPARDLLDGEWYSKRGSLIRGLWLKTATVITSRGCPGMCIYCGSHATFGRKIRRRSVDNVMGEINQLIKEYGIQGIFFCDDTMTMSQEWMMEFCDALKNLDHKIVWACQSRVNTVNKELLNEMKAAGCIQIEYGCESGSQKVLNGLKKGVSVAQTIRAFELTKRFGIRTMANFMIGNPGETHDDIKMTAKLAKRLDADWTEFWITTPYPGSELFEMAKKNGWIKIPLDSGVWMHGYDSVKPVMEINFKGEELLEMRNSMYSKRFSSMLKGLSLSHMFAYDLVKHTLTHPLKVLSETKSLSKGFVNFGFNVEKQLRGEKKDIVL